MYQIKINVLHVIPFMYFYYLRSYSALKSPNKPAVPPKPKNINNKSSPSPKKSSQVSNRISPLASKSNKNGNNSSEMRPRDHSNSSLTSEETKSRKANDVEAGKGSLIKS